MIRFRVEWSAKGWAVVRVSDMGASALAWFPRFSDALKLARMLS